MQKPLPDLCFSTLPGTGDLICIKRGETGYYPSDWNTGDPVQNRELADYNNRRLGVSYAVEQAFLTGSMSGWDVPGANPQFYLDHAVYQQSRDIKGHIKDDVMTVYYPIAGTLCQYQVLSKEQDYFPLTALPPGILGEKSDLTVLPDMICGKPFVQVEALHAENGSYTLHLLSHCLTHDTKEVNAGYRIDMRIQVGGQEVVLGHSSKAPAPYATWRRTPANDKDGPHNYYWGHYFGTREGAVTDFCDRAIQEYKQLAQRRAQPPQSKKRHEPER
jgi:hypothetical protein